MIGNVWEWTSSPMRAYPGGRAVADSLAQYRVIRGGAHNTHDSVATSWWRLPYHPSSERQYLDATGFRCAMSVRAPRETQKR
jgi:formylglycine-generating enzyme required for sulfatase activity